LLLTVLLIDPASVTSADLNSEITEMFQRWGTRVNYTDAGAYHSQSRGFIVGGSLSARVPRDTLQPLSWKEPSIKAGCGGIDIFGGSFSFINADQFVQFLQKIGQNALGYAFSLGLEAVCPTCNSVIKNLRDQMNKLNKLNMDSCTSAKALVNGIGGGMELWNLESCKNEKGQGDPVTGWLECASGNEASVRQQIRDHTRTKSEEAAADKIKGAPRGATTAQALQWSGLTDEQKQQVMSLVGTWSTRSAEPTSACVYIPPSLTLADLVHGGDVKLLSCGSGGLGDGAYCEDVAQGGTTTIDGFTKHVKDKMIAIMNKYKATPPVALTQDEQAFVNTVSIPPVAYMLRSSLSYSDTLASNLIDLTAEVAAASMAWHLIENYLKAYEEGQSSISSCGLKYSDIASQIRRIRDERQALYDKYMMGFNSQIAMMKFLENIDAKVAAHASQNIQRAINKKWY
jgi:conjugative transfer pilus assembly protein TraH